MSFKCFELSIEKINVFKIKLKMNPKLLFTFTLLTISSLAILNSCVKTPDDNPTTTTSSTSTTSEPSSCDTCLPPITMEGKNTFGCKINGKIWLPKSGKLIPGMRISYNEETIIISTNHVPNRDVLNFAFENIVDTGFFSLPSQLNVMAARYGRTKPNGGYAFLYECDNLTSGYFYLTRLNLSSSGFVSGTFAFDVYSDDFLDTVHITEGRFDIRF
jgi:hypothetical protein